MRGRLRSQRDCLYKFRGGGCRRSNPSCGSTDSSRVRFFPAGGDGRGLPAPRRRGDECLRREGAPSTAWGDPSTGPGLLDSRSDGRKELKREQHFVCARVGVEPDVPAPFQKVGIALHTRHLEPLNGLRHSTQGDSSGWFIWGGTDLSQAPDFFAPLHVTHLNERCPRALKYLALPPGWRFLVAPGQEDLWFDPKLLEI